jgi:hypothetical protein
MRVAARQHIPAIRLGKKPMRPTRKSWETAKERDVALASQPTVSEAKWDEEKKTRFKVPQGAI